MRVFFKADAEKRRQRFPLAVEGKTAEMWVDECDFPGVKRAAGDLADDVERVCGLRPRLIEDPEGRDLVIVGSLGRSALIDELAKKGKIAAGKIAGKWEATLIQTVDAPFPGVERALVIAGSDKRGAIYGAYELSRRIGVSPWYWWADVPVREHPSIFVEEGLFLDEGPAVRYRGIFLNDEAPALSQWAKETFGGFNHHFYEKVFELLLRLKANYLWPAMWGSAFSDDDARSPELADEYGIVIGTSHHEPMMRAHAEWRRYGMGPWNYRENDSKLRDFWTEGVTRAKGKEVTITIGMRGDGDEAMTEEADIALLERIVEDQRKIIGERLGEQAKETPQVWALYKEVQEYYEKGMRVGDDVTLLWSDDNWGNIRRLPTESERERSGGAGIYYHFDYVGGPRSYKWINTTSLPKIWEQMHLAYRFGADRLWVVNVGDLKPMEYPMEFFLTYAWNPDALGVEDIAAFGRAWAEQQFGGEHAEEIESILASYAKFSGRRKPELLDADTYSLIDYREADTIVEEHKGLLERAEKVYATLPEDARDAFYQIVLHQVKAAATLTEMYVAIAKNRLYAVQGRASTNAMAEAARALFRRDAELTRYFHEDLAKGKWKHMMAQNHIGYTYWNQPIRNAMPGVQEIQPSEHGELGVAVEGTAQSRPDWFEEPLSLPALSVYDRKSRYIEVFNRGTGELRYAIETSDPWLVADHPKGRLGPDVRVEFSVRWEEVPLGRDGATIAVTGSDGTKVVVHAPLFAPPEPKRTDLRGFVECEGHVSIEAEHFDRASPRTGRRWLRIPDHGRTLSGMTLLPVTAQRETLDEETSRLEYRMYLFTPGTTRVDAILAPTRNFKAGDGLRYAISFDSEPPVLVNVHEDTSTGAWEKDVSDGAMVRTSTHSVAREGYHTLSFWSIDPGLVLQKLVVYTSAPRPCYLGPPESFRGVAKK